MVVNIAWQLTDWLFSVIGGGVGGEQVVLVHSQSMKTCASNRVNKDIHFSKSYFRVMLFFFKKKRSSSVNVLKYQDEKIKNLEQTLRIHLSVSHYQENILEKSIIVKAAGIQTV